MPAKKAFYIELVVVPSKPSDRNQSGLCKNEALPLPPINSDFLVSDVNEVSVKR